MTVSCAFGTPIAELSELMKKYYLQAYYSETSDTVHS